MQETIHMQGNGYMQVSVGKRAKKEASPDMAGYQWRYVPDMYRAWPVHAPHQSMHHQITPKIDKSCKSYEKVDNGDIQFVITDLESQEAYIY